MAQEQYQELWLSLTNDEKMAIFAFIDSHIGGVSRFWILGMLSGTQTPPETLDSLIEKEIVEAGEDQGDRTMYKLADTNFYQWVIDTFTKPRQ